MIVTAAIAPASPWFFLLPFHLMVPRKPSGVCRDMEEVSTAEQNQAVGRRKSRPLGAASGERREGVARLEFPACGVGYFREGFSLPFGRGFGRDDSCRRSSRGC